LDELRCALDSRVAPAPGRVSGSASLCVS
jgi:hypothetical protein